VCTWSPFRPIGSALSSVRLNSRASTTDHLQALRPETSREVEYALLLSPGGDTCVTVASDHSDQTFEHSGIQLSQLYPDVFAANVDHTRSWSHSGTTSS
jgi:hypothetical protein